MAGLAELLAAAAGPYDTPLTPEQEQQFQLWKQQYAPRDSGMDYDLRGAFLEGVKRDEASGHWTDQFKKPNHPTFSDQSQYSSREHPGGHWYGDKFVPFGPRLNPRR
jgi:hypothetical protein